MKAEIAMTSSYEFSAGLKLTIKIWAVKYHYILTICFPTTLWTHDRYIQVNKDIVTSQMWREVIKNL